LKIDPPEALGPKPRVLGCPKLLSRVTREKLGRPTKFHQKSRIRSKVIQQSLGDGQTDRQTDAIPPPTPIRAGENFYLYKFSTIPLTTFAHFVRSLRSRNDYIQVQEQILNQALNYHLVHFNNTFYVIIKAFSIGKTLRQKIIE
jgi:hypothetical protein